MLKRKLKGRRGIKERNWVIMMQSKLKIRIIIRITVQAIIIQTISKKVIIPI